MRKVKNSQRRPGEIRGDEPQLQPCGLDLRAFECCLRGVNCYRVFVCFDTSRELLSSKQRLLTHPCANIPAEGREFSTLIAWLSEAQSRACDNSARAWTIFVLVCKEIVIMGKYLSCATVNLTSHTFYKWGTASERLMTAV